MQEGFRQKYRVQLNTKPTESAQQGKCQEENELLEYYNEEHKKLGIANREEAIKKGLLLEAVQLWIINPDTKEVLLQRRNKNKKHDPYMIDTSCSGHVNPKETHTQAMLREAQEELGIVPQDLLPNLKYLTAIHTDLADYGREGNYIIYSYLSFDKKPIEHYKIQEDEIDHIFFMKYEKIKEMIIEKDNQVRIPCNEETMRVLKIIDEQINRDKPDISDKDKEK